MVGTITSAGLKQKNNNHSSIKKTDPISGGGRQNASSASLEPFMIDKVPLEPPFTRSQLKNAIPPHCFERSHWRSFGSLFLNLIAVYATYLIFPAIIQSPSIPPLIATLLWPIYWFVQGAFCTGIWVLAHECGHRAFSPHVIVNDTVGLILHSALLVPYHSWRISHGKHHSNTNHLERDEVFVPLTIDQVNDPQEYADGFFLRTAFGRLCSIVVTLTLGWPAYLLFNSAGRKYDRPASHFNPSSPIFTDKQYGEIVLSDVALLAVLAVLGVWAYNTSVLYVLAHYGVPYLWVNFWLVLITLLQHTDYALPHYDGEDWTWVKGALCTVDRDYGILNLVFHRIGDTHVVHHLFHELPHYHAKEATEHIAKILGPYYRQDSTPIMKALWQAFERCTLVTPVKEKKGTFWWLTLEELRNYIKSKTN